MLGALVSLAVAIVSVRTTAQAVVAGDRTVAYTFDDLPATRFTSLDDARFITARLLAQIRARGLPAIGFVNEGKLQAPGEEAGRAALLEAWLDAGLDLGNHTYSHMRLYDATLADFQADVLRGERVTRRLMAAWGGRPRYVRHPTLNTGRDLETKRALERFLADHGYTVAPVTIDSDEYLYALAYDRARARGDRRMMDRLGRDYLRYMREIFGFYERLSRSLLGREPAQVLLLHANALNADWLDELAAMIAGRGYRAVTLSEALTDSAYALPDDYVGPRGPSWLERWARTQGREVGAPPPVPRWVGGRRTVGCSPRTASGSVEGRVSRVENRRGHHDTGNARMRPLSIAGLLLIAAGLFVALRGVSYSSSRSDVRVGDFRASLEERRTIPSWMGWAGAGLGLVLVVTSLRSRRGS